MSILVQEYVDEYQIASALQNGDELNWIDLFCQTMVEERDLQRITRHIPEFHEGTADQQVLPDRLRALADALDAHNMDMDE